MPSLDLVIVGAGPAGMTAAIYAKRRNLSFRIFEKAAIGGMTSSAVRVENYLGTGALSGKELMEKFAKQLSDFDVEIEKKEVKEIKRKNSVFEVSLDGEKLECRAVILATGTKHKKLNVKGEEEFFGKGVSYCTICDGIYFKKKDVVVAGAGNSGVSAAIYLSEICKSVTLVEFLPNFRCDETYVEQLGKTKVNVLLNHEVKEISGKENVEGVRLKDRKSGEEKTINTSGVFIYAGMLPQNKLAKDLGLKMDENGFISADENCKTSIEGVFAAGDINGKLAQTVIASGYGAVAALSAYDYLKGLL